MSNVFEIQPKWNDSKKYLWLMGVLLTGVPINALILNAITDYNIFLWFGPIVILFIAPTMDLILGEDESNPPESAVKVLERDSYYIKAIYLSAIGLFVGFIASAYFISSQEISWISYLGLSLTVGTSSGVSINTAHELGHKKSVVAQWMAKLTLAPVGYGHFFVEHNRGHHVRVATHEDPATSRYGENFWSFLPRSIFGGIKSAIALENRRLKALNLPKFSLQNEVIHSWLMSLFLWGGLVAFFGIKIIPFLLIQSVFGISLLEAINYVEHYGLQREKLNSGQYEACKPIHSWNSNSLNSNIFLYQLQRHSDHHAHPTRSYQSLRHFASSPQLPAGYGTMLLLACIPPLWFKIMNPRVDAFYKNSAAQEQKTFKVVS